ncbi:IS30 family transposase, partial [Photobacterium damselae]|uniref:IS30 family transposase n=1 Tax=Photobacterium damselae TaxID=38293 RepID=UPI002F3FFBDE
SDDSRYRPDRANTLSVQRRSQASKYRISQDTIWFVEMALGWDWSPEQISAIAKRIDLPVSPEWIYQHIARNKAHVHTITFDNGGEFAGHEGIAAALDAKVYFAHPYSSWERGLNENFNGLLRQYVPKGTDLRQVSDEYIEQAQTRINLRPRKCLEFRQPKV